MGFQPAPVDEPHPAYAAAPRSTTADASTSNRLSPSADRAAAQRTADSDKAAARAKRPAASASATMIAGTASHPAEAPGQARTNAGQATRP